MLADPGPGPPADEAERDVGAELGGNVEVGHAGPAEHRGGVGRATAEPTAGGDALVDAHPRRDPPAAQRLATRLVSSTGTPSANGPMTSSPDRRRSTVSSSARSSVAISASMRW